MSTQPNPIAVDERQYAEGSGHLLMSTCCDCGGRALAADGYRGEVRCGDCWSKFCREVVS